MASRSPSRHPGCGICFEQARDSGLYRDGRSGKEYAPLVQSAFNASGQLLSDLGPLSIGECYLSCDISDGVESDLPVVIEGVVTSGPAARAGIVAAQAGIGPLDGSRSVWSITIPGLGIGEANAFQTGTDTCAGFCAPYRFTLPTRAPLVASPADVTFTGPSGPVTPPGTRYTQERGLDAYTIYATASGCKYPVFRRGYDKRQEIVLARDSGGDAPRGGRCFYRMSVSRERHFPM